VRALRILAIVGLLVVAMIATLHAAFPPNETEAEGCADPFLSVRRPVLEALVAAHVLGRRDADHYLPTSSESGSCCEVLPGGERLPVCEQLVTREPVSRGLLWRVGRRITYRLAYLRDHDEQWRTVRLCYAMGPERFVAVERATADPDVAEVSGFVPDSARGYWIECSDVTGKYCWTNAWGSTEPFVGD
jgi:hypothetical protein